MPVWIIFTLGFTAQLLFFSRTLIQWIFSEREGRVVSPTLYWQFSLYASILMLFYGIFRQDLAICIGQMLVYTIYIRNLQLKGAWGQMSFAIRLFIIILPFVVLGWLTQYSGDLFAGLMNNNDIPTIWVWWGTAAQLFFTFRFIYQWMVSERQKSSELPLGFWLISVTGSVMILVYAMFRLDPVLLASHSVGVLLYARNIYIHRISAIRKSSARPIIKN